MSESHHLFDLVYQEPDAFAMEAKPATWTALRWLTERHIFSIEKTVDGGHEVVERCDGYHRAPMSRADLLQLAEEIKQLAEGA